MSIALVGDIHGNFSKFHKIVSEISKVHSVKAVIQVGDFGYYPNLVRQLESMDWPLPIYWIDGNHECFKLFHHLTEVTEVHKNIFYVPRGSIVEIDGKKIAFLGGAGSVDKDIRLQYGMDWSPLENISPDEVLRFGDESNVDLFVTHVPPQSVIQKHFDPMHLVMYFGLPASWRDPNADVVEHVWNKFNKPPMYCGHMHRSVVDGNCRILNIEEVVYIP